MGARQFRADLNQTVLIINPETLPSSRDSFTTSGIYQPDFTLLDGKNCLPSVTGYFSFFGTEVDFGDNYPVDDVQDVITFRTHTGDTLLIGMSPDGLYMKSVAGNAVPTTDDNINTPDPDADTLRGRHLIGWEDITMPQGKCDWIRIANAPLGSPNPWSLWTYAIVNNKLYFYQQGLGYIVHIYGHEKDIIRVDRLEPSYIIGEVDQYQWIINGVDSNTSCTDTEKSIQIPGVGTFYVFNLDKAHYVKNIKQIWLDSTLGFLGQGVRVEYNSNNYVPLTGTIEFTPALCSLPTQIPSLEDINVVGNTAIGAGVTNNQWNMYLHDALAGCADATSYYAYLSNGTLQLRPLVQNINAGDCYTSGLQALGGIDAGNLPAGGVLISFDWAMQVSAVVNPPTESNVHQIVGGLQVAATPSNDYDTFFCRTADNDYDAENLSGSDVIMLYNAQSMRFGSNATQYTDTGNNLSYRTSGLDISNIRIWEPYNALAKYVVVGTGDAGDNPSVNRVGGRDFYDTAIDAKCFGLYDDGVGYQGESASTVASISIFDGAAATVYLKYRSYMWSPIALPDKTLYTGYLITDQVLTRIDETTPGVVILSQVGAGFDAPRREDQAALYVSLASGDLALSIPAGYYLYFWSTGYSLSSTYGQPDEILVSGVSVYNFHSQADIDACAGPGGTPVEITLDHNGMPEELISSYDINSSTLAISSFKEFNLTGVNILAGGVNVGSFSVPAIHDSNDLWNTLLLELAAALPQYNLTSNLIQAASANADYDITISYIDFAEDAPVPVLANDGDCTWLVSATNTAPLKLAQVSGITSARGRLMAWDRENALYTSSNQDPLDFTPDISTQANVGKAQAVQGDIILCLGWNNGFIIYSTGNVVHADYTGGTYVFNYEAISDYGVIDPRHVTGNFESQFLWTNKGLILVDPVKKTAEEVAPDMTDWLNRHKFPIKTSYIGDRYVILSLLSTPIELYTPAQRRDGSATRYERGEAEFVARSSVLAELKTFPYGSNLFGTYQVGLIYDTVLQKWGIAVLPYKTMFSLNPINAKGFPSEKSPEQTEATYFNRIRSLGGILDNNATVIFNDAPEDSYICIGHSKLDVHMWSSIVKVTAEYIDYADAVIELEPSWDDRTVNWEKVLISPRGTDAIQEFPVAMPCAWFNTTIRGKYHLRSLVIRGFVSGDN